MRRVKVYKNGEILTEGLFHEFGLNYTEFESGPGNFSTAIVELEDGKIINVPVETIVFQ